MNAQLSINKQKIWGTYDRNEEIRLLVKNGMSQAVVGRMADISRERVRQIFNQIGGVKWQFYFGVMLPNVNPYG